MVAAASLLARSAESLGMPALTRRRDPDIPQECLRVYYGELHAGTIAQCVGNLGASPKWQ
jgi:hypothetical protein